MSKNSIQKGELHLAVSWYRPEQWPLLLGLSVDAPTLEPTYEKWLEKATQNLSEIKKASIRPVKIDVDVKKLSKWCKVKNRHLNNQASFDYSAEKLRQPYEKSKLSRLILRKVLRIFMEFIRHPTILVLLGAGLTVLLLPGLNFNAEQKRILYEKRINLAIEITNQNLLINGKLNAMQSILELFHKDNQVVEPNQLDIKQEQKNLRSRHNIVYLEVDKCVWFWHWAILWKANILGIMSEVELDYLKNKNLDYQKNVLRCMKIIDDFRMACLSNEYSPFDSKLTELMNNTREELIKLNRERDMLIEEMVDIFILRKN